MPKHENINVGENANELIKWRTIKNFCKRIIKNFEVSWTSDLWAKSGYKRAKNKLVSRFPEVPKDLIDKEVIISYELKESWTCHKITLKNDYIRVSTITPPDGTFTFKDDITDYMIGREENGRRFTHFHLSAGDGGDNYRNWDIDGFKDAFKYFLEGADKNKCKVEVHPLNKSQSNE